jgi:hypothetical protein
VGERRRKSVQGSVALVTAFVTGDIEVPEIEIIKEALREDAFGVLIAMTDSRVHLGKDMRQRV